ncbi:DNA (cytosine-5-)-methyltransferase [Chryseobacterium sp. WLY505]|uniref:DNA (cytosine-5-)-methyltransferase n=1 Tax=Chryseobacterium sp. WLY505 TaxID=3068892 RepID=UPI002796BB63|nr:DNA (cytosine-5-)-methyltransferase [Chryseobacterium sp. WLY505]MDQ1858308.1 DNA (cytosine-5-)-methyltransferase [Chryseobacterium sp. WLY505]
MNKKFTVGSLYAGIGGICLGFKKAKFNISWANEYDKNACVTYRHNFSHQLYENDIISFDINKLKKIDVLAAGFPCQPFSVAGYRKGFTDDRGNHFFRIMEIVDLIRPKVIFLENVKNLVGHDHGNTFKVIQENLESRGYTFDAKVLNTKDYGDIPHNRERIFMVCFDKNILQHPDDFKFQFPKKDPLKRKIKDLIIHEKVDDKFYYGKDKYMYHMLEETMTKEDTIYQFRRQYVRENKSNVCPTLTANMGTGGHNVPMVKTEFGFRKLTPRECFRFQGFPDDFKLPEIANSHLYKQAGNSVSVPVIERLAGKIFDVLESNTL